MRYRREGGGLGVDLMVVWSVLRGGGHSSSLLNEKSARAAGSTQRVAALRGHVVCISEDRASGTRRENGWC